MDNLKEQFRLCMRDQKLTDYEIQLLRSHIDFSDFSFKEGRQALLDVLSENAAALDALAVLKWVKEIEKIIVEPEQSKFQQHVCFSPGTDCLSLLEDALRGAKASVDVCVYTISDNRLSNLLLELHRAKRQIRIITDDQKRDDIGSDVNRLHKEGIPVKVDFSRSFMHNKFAIVDHTGLLSGSYNWTRGASDRNYENLIYTDNPELLKPFITEFERLWNNNELRDLKELKGS